MLGFQCTLQPANICVLLTSDMHIYVVQLVNTALYGKLFMPLAHWAGDMAPSH